MGYARLLRFHAVREPSVPCCGGYRALGDTVLWGHHAVGDAVCFGSRAVYADPEKVNKLLMK